MFIFITSIRLSLHLPHKEILFFGQSVNIEIYQISRRCSQPISTLLFKISQQPGASINCTYVHFTSLPIIRISMFSIFFFKENISLNVIFITRLRKSTNSFSIFVSEGENTNVCMQIKRCLTAQYWMVNINDFMVRKKSFSDCISLLE